MLPDNRYTHNRSASTWGGLERNLGIDKTCYKVTEILTTDLIDQAQSGGASLINL